MITKSTGDIMFLYPINNIYSLYIYIYIYISYVYVYIYTHTHTHTSHLVHMKYDTLGKSHINTFPRRAFLLNPVMFSLPPNINSI